MLFLSCFVIFFTIVICNDLQNKHRVTSEFIDSLEHNNQLNELIGEGYQLKDVKTEGTFVNPTIHTVVSHLGFNFLVEFKNREVSTVNLVVHCKLNVETKKKTCYQQQLYPKNVDKTVY